MAQNKRKVWKLNVKLIQMCTVILLVTIVALFSAKIFLTKKVVIVDKNIDIEATTLNYSVKSLLKEFDIVLEPADKLSVEPKSRLKDGMVIEITRAFPVNVEISGQIEKFMTTENKVENILNEMEIELGELDVVLPAASERVFENGLIRIIRIDEKVVKEVVKQPFDTIVKLDSKLKPGQEVVETEGQMGEKELVFKYTYEDEKEIIRSLKEENIKTEAIDRVVRKGSEMLYVTDQGKPYLCSAIYTMKSSAYDLSFASCGKYPDHPQYGITRSGTKARPGVVAVDPKTIKLKSKLYVESLDRTQDYGFASAEDTGGAIKNNRIDLFIGNNREAYRYGMRNVKVYVLDETIDESLIVGYGY